MKKILLMTLIGGATVLSSAAHAEGAYVGAALGGTHYNLGYLAPGATSTGDDGKGEKLTPKLVVGYDINQTWAVEGGYAWLGKPNYSFSQDGVFGSAEAKSRAMYVAAKATMPINSTVSVYGKLGASDNRYTVNGSGSGAGLTGVTKNTGLYVGVGTQYALNKNVALTLEYENFGKMTADNTRAAAITVGAKYSF